MYSYTPDARFHVANRCKSDLMLFFEQGLNLSETRVHNRLIYCTFFTIAADYNISSSKEKSFFGSLSSYFFDISL